jgi:hypothetical protein
MAQIVVESRETCELIVEDTIVEDLYVREEDINWAMDIVDYAC